MARKVGSNGTVLGMVLTSWSRKMARFCRRQIMSKSFQSLRLYLRRLLQKYNGGMHGSRTTPWTAQAPASSEQDPAVPTAAPFHWLQAPRRPPANRASSFSYQPAETVTILLSRNCCSTHLRCGEFLILIKSRRVDCRTTGNDSWARKWAGGGQSRRLGTGGAGHGSSGSGSECVLQTTTSGFQKLVCGSGRS